VKPRRFHLDPEHMRSIHNKMKRQAGDKWTQRDWHRLSYGLFILGSILFIFSSCVYYFGLAEHISESRFRGSQHYAAIPPGLPLPRMIMYGGFGLMVGGLALILGMSVKKLLKKENRTRA